MNLGGWFLIANIVATWVGIPLAVWLNRERPIAPTESMPQTPPGASDGMDRKSREEVAHPLA
jgi:hypothetical protein